MRLATGFPLEAVRSPGCKVEGPLFVTSSRFVLCKSLPPLVADDSFGQCFGCFLTNIGLQENL